MNSCLHSEPRCYRRILCSIEIEEQLSIGYDDRRDSNSNYLQFVRCYGHHRLLAHNNTRRSSTLIRLLTYSLFGQIISYKEIVQQVSRCAIHFYIDIQFNRIVRIDTDLVMHN